jgi:WS/DGAT/MGAT family acyltransferase
VQQLNHQDTMFLYSETPRTYMHLSSLHIYNQTTAPVPVTFDAIVEQVRSRMPLTRVLRRRLVRVPLNLDYPYWVEDENFDIEFHVRHIAIPSPGNKRQVWVQASRLHSQPLDLSRPPWELYVIDGIDAVEGAPPGSFALFIKVHHSAIDGISGIELMSALHDLSPDGRPVTTDSWHGERPPSSVEMLARAAGHVVRVPGRMFRVASRTLPVVRSLRDRSELRGGPMGRFPRTVLNDKVRTNRIAEGFRFDLAAAKRIRTAVPGATVNDVILAVVGGGLRAYLQSRDALPDEPLWAGVPISLRTPDEADAVGNKIGMMVVTLGTDIADPVERLTAIQQSTSASKEVETAVGARTLAESAELFPGLLLGTAVRALPEMGPGGLAQMVGNVCVTNVPGSQAPLYLCGARMEAYYGLGPVYDYAGPIHLVVSYVGRIYLSVTSSRDLMPDVDRYIADLKAALAGLEAATTEAEEPAPRARRAKRSTAPTTGSR